MTKPSPYGTRVDTNEYLGCENLSYLDHGSSVLNYIPPNVSTGFDLQLNQVSFWLFVVYIAVVNE